MCIKESLRLYPPVPYIGKKLSEDFFVEGNRIPKGVAIINDNMISMVYYSSISNYATRCVRTV